MPVHTPQQIITASKSLGDVNTPINNKVKKKKSNDVKNCIL